MVKRRTSREKREHRHLSLRTPKRREKGGVSGRSPKRKKRGPLTMSERPAMTKTEKSGR